jgi:hypothetical protein
MVFQMERKRGSPEPGASLACSCKGRRETCNLWLGQSEWWREVGGHGARFSGALWPRLDGGFCCGGS